MGVGVGGGVIELDGGNIVLRIPEGFNQMKPGGAQRKFPKLGGFAMAYLSSPNGDSSLVVASIPLVNQGKGGGAGHACNAATTLEASDGITLERVGGETINGRKWGILEFRSEVLDTTIHNVILVTPRGGAMLAFAFSTTSESWERMRAPSRLPPGAYWLGATELRRTRTLSGDFRLDLRPGGLHA